MYWMKQIISEYMTSVLDKSLAENHYSFVLLSVICKTVNSYADVRPE